MEEDYISIDSLTRLSSGFLKHRSEKLSEIVSVSGTQIFTLDNSNMGCFIFKIKRSRSLLIKWFLFTQEEEFITPYEIITIEDVVSNISLLNSNAILFNLDIFNK